MRTQNEQICSEDFFCVISLKVELFKFLALGIHVLTFSWILESLQIITRVHKPDQVVLATTDLKEIRYV
jgi:hypothetical protein